MSSSEKSSVARSSLIMASGTFVSRILGMVRSPIILTMIVGLNAPIANAFDVANTLPNLLFNYIAAGMIDAVLVPAIVHAVKNDKDGGAAYLNKIFTIALIFLGGITLLLTLAAPLVVKLFASTMSPQWYAITTMMAYWCIPQIFFYGFTAVLGQILNAKEKFGPYMWAPVANNIVAIVGFLVLLGIFGSPSTQELENPHVWEGGRSLALAIISTSGIAIQALILLLPMSRLGIKLRLDFHWRGAGLRSTGKASLWATIAALASFAPSVVLTNVAAGATQRALTAGIDLATVPGNAAYNTAFALFMMPVSLITTSIVTAMFTKLASSAAVKNIPLMRDQVKSTANIIGTFNFLVMALMIVFARPLARIFVPAGSSQEISSLAILISILSFSLVPFSLMYVWDRVGYAFEDTFGPFLAHLPKLIIMATGYSLCALLPPQYTLRGAAISAVTATFVSCIAGFMYARRKIGSVHGKEIVVTHLKLAALSCIVVFVGVGVFAFIGMETIASSIWKSVMSGAVGGLLLSALYVGLMKLFRVPEADVFFDMLIKLRKKLQH